MFPAESLPGRARPCDHDVQVMSWAWNVTGWPFLAAQSDCEERHLLLDDGMIRYGIARCDELRIAGRRTTAPLLSLAHS